MTDAEAVMSALWWQDDSPSWYPHAMFSVGVANHPDGDVIVAIHVTMGQAKFVHWIRPSSARMIARHMLDMADKAEAENGERNDTTDTENAQR
jgi:hypothetical protein